MPRGGSGSSKRARSGSKRKSSRTGSRRRRDERNEVVKDDTEPEEAAPTYNVSVHGGDGAVDSASAEAADAGLLAHAHPPAGDASAAPPGHVGHNDKRDFTTLRNRIVCWNAVQLALSISLLVEGVFLMYQAYDIHDVLSNGLSNATTMSQANATQIAATEGGLGVSVVTTGFLAFILAATQYTRCCHAECCAQMSYLIWSMFLVIYELGVAFALVAVANWDKVQKKIENGDFASKHANKLAELAVPAYGPGARGNLYAIVGVLVLSGIMQVGAVVLHVRRRNELANWFINGGEAEEYNTLGSQTYGSGSKDESKNEARLAELRNYYAQLYAEHGLTVPKELRRSDDHV